MTDLPENNVFEVSLIGTGGGYGESVVIHLGNRNWIVVDSCINPKTKASLPLEYLKSIGVNVAIDVKLIICSHWDDDHILGISELLNSAASSIFCMARTTDSKKFLQLLGLDFNKAKSESSASSTTEINKCLEILKGRNATIKGAEQDKLLLKFEEKGIVSQVFSLSPSDFVVSEFDGEISTLISDYGCSNRKIIFNSPNAKSVALLVSVNEHIVLLGSDLEISKDVRKGWLCVLEKCQCIDSKKSSLFKIPHHGSENGFDINLWDKLVLPNATAKLTPWNLGGKLPKKKMLDIFLNHTDKLYITSLNFTSNSAKKREHSISKAISKFNNTLTEVKFKYGLVRSRRDILYGSEEWQSVLFGSAAKITNELIAKEK